VSARERINIDRLFAALHLLTVWNGKFSASVSRKSASSVESASFKSDARTRAHLKANAKQSDVSPDCARSAMLSRIAFMTSSVAYVNRRNYSSAACAAANRAMGIRNGLQLTYSRPSR
jgi:hypothetical protein